MELTDATGKIPATRGIDLGTFRLVQQCLNHYATPGPYIYFLNSYMIVEFLAALSV